MLTRGTRAATCRCGMLTSICQHDSAYPLPARVRAHMRARCAHYGRRWTTCSREAREQSYADVECPHLHAYMLTPIRFPPVCELVYALVARITVVVVSRRLRQPCMRSTHAECPECPAFAHTISHVCTQRDAKKGPRIGIANSLQQYRTLAKRSKDRRARARG